MITVPVFNMQGVQTGQESIDPAVLGGEVRTALMKQAIVTFLDHQRQYSARTKGRSQVAGSTRKLYRQKGTGNARPGPIRVPQRRGGGRAHAKVRPNAFKELPKKMRRAARNSALLVKFQSNDVLILDGLSFPQPRTKDFALMMGKLGAEKGLLLAMDAPDHNTYLSGRNVPKVDIRTVDQLTTYEVLRRRKLVLTPGAFQQIKTGTGVFGA